MPRLSELSRSIEGRVALVTGAASGMGRATARLFADEGAKVALADLQEAEVEAAAEEIRAAGGSARAWTLDVRDPGRIRGVVDEVVAHFGGLGILVNNAGVSRPSGVEAPDYDEAWEATLSVNLDAHQRLIRAALPALLESAGGRVVNVASTEGLGATAGLSAYTASKHAVIGLTRSLAMELGRRDVTVNCICPGPIHTGMTALIPDDMKQKFARRRVPLGRYGTPEEVAHMTLSLCLPAARYTTGVALPVDGGLTIQNT